MPSRIAGACALTAFLAVPLMAPALAAAQTGPGGATSGWTPPRTPWGDPDLQGIFTNKDENGTPMERPDEFEGRTLDEVRAADLAKLVQERQEQHDARAPGLGGADTGAGPPHWFESFGAANSQPWLVLDPPDGRIPPLTEEAEARRRRPARPTRGFNDPADSHADFGLYERCITLGLPGSMTPMIYGNAYQIVQGPGFVGIRYEMVHETRIIPLDGAPHVGEAIRPYMGDARGRWEGDTLVVETTNFKAGQRGSTDRLRLIERFTRIAPDKVYWEVTFEDPATWTRPWTYGMPLTQDPGHQVFEYACHEGNHGLPNILSASRADEAGK